MKKLMLVTLVAGLAGFIGANVQGGIGPPHEDAFWVDDELYRTVGTPTDLPNRGPKDGLYVFLDQSEGGLDGQTPVGEAKPGDRDYNGGRWQVTVLTFTAAGRLVHDSNMDGVVDFQLTNWEMVEHHLNNLGHLEVVGPGRSFVCPVIEQ